jgi:hypothetical protein
VHTYHGEGMHCQTCYTALAIGIVTHDFGCFVGLDSVDYTNLVDCTAAVATATTLKGNDLVMDIVLGFSTFVKINFAFLNIAADLGETIDWPTNLNYTSYCKLIVDGTDSSLSLGLHKFEYLPQLRKCSHKQAVEGFVLSIMGYSTVVRQLKVIHKANYCFKVLLDFVHNMDHYLVVHFTVRQDWGLLKFMRERQNKNPEVIVTLSFVIPLFCQLMCLFGSFRLVWELTL